MVSFIEIYQRILQVTGVRTQMELAHFLEIRQSSISDAKRRNSIPPVWYLKLCEKHGVNPTWLKTGTGPMHMIPKVWDTDILEAIQLDGTYGRGLSKPPSPPLTDQTPFPQH